jgi:hypothetical protein
LLVQLTALLGNALAGRVAAGGDLSLGTAWQRSVLASGRAAYSAEPPAVGDADWWVLAVVSLLALLAAGGAAGWMARRLARRAKPELVVLLDESAAFYGRWPEDRLSRAPRDQLVAEAARCRRIIELLELRRAPGTAGRLDEAGPIVGLRAWIALVSKRIDGGLDVRSGTAYA